jgi:hypothetical protein
MKTASCDLVKKYAELAREQFFKRIFAPTRKVHAYGKIVATSYS